MSRDSPAVFFQRGDRAVTYVTPPKLSSFPVEREQIEYSSRSPVFRSDGEGVLRVWGNPEAPWVLGVTPEGSRWRITAWGAPPSAARQAARSLFSFDHPVEEFYRLARSEPVLAPAIRRFRGLRIPRDANLYEALLHSIIGQQLSVQAANSLKRRLFERTDAFLQAEGVEVPHVPSPTRLRDLGPQGLRAVGLSRAKSHSLVALAERQTAQHFGALDWSKLPLEEAVERLDAEPGVGRWTAENALLRGIGRPDVFIAGDLGIRYALQHYGAVRRSATEERIRRWAEARYPEWGSYATLYLWRRWIDESRAAAGG